MTAVLSHTSGPWNFLDPRRASVFVLSEDRSRVEWEWLIYGQRWQQPSSSIDSIQALRARGRIWSWDEVRDAHPEWFLPVDPPPPVWLPANLAVGAGL